MPVVRPDPQSPVGEQIAALAARLSCAQSMADADLAEVADLIGEAIMFAFVNAYVALFCR